MQSFVHYCRLFEIRKNVCLYYWHNIPINPLTSSLKHQRSLVLKRRFLFTLKNQNSDCQKNNQKTQKNMQKIEEELQQLEFESELEEELELMYCE